MCEISKLVSAAAFRVNNFTVLLVPLMFPAAFHSLLKDSAQVLNGCGMFSEWPLHDVYHYSTSYLGSAGHFTHSATTSSSPSLVSLQNCSRSSWRQSSRPFYHSHGDRKLLVGRGAGSNLLWKNVIIVVVVTHVWWYQLKHSIQIELNYIFNQIISIFAWAYCLRA